MEDRFKAWINEQPVLSAGILFAKEEKMQEADYRWAPATVLPEDIQHDEIIRRRPKGPKQEAPYDSALEICLILESTVESTEQQSYPTTRDSQSWFYFTEANSSVAYEAMEDSGVDPKKQDANMLDGKPGMLAVIPARWPQPGDTEIGVLLQYIEEFEHRILGAFPVRIQVKALLGKKCIARNMATGRKTKASQQWRIP